MCPSQYQEKIYDIYNYFFKTHCKNVVVNYSLKIGGPFEFIRFTMHKNSYIGPGWNNSIFNTGIDIYGYPTPLEFNIPICSSTCFFSLPFFWIFEIFIASDNE